MCSLTFFRCVNTDKSFPPDLLFNPSFSRCYVGNTHSEARRCFHTRTKRLLKSFIHATDVYVISHQRRWFCSLIRAQTFTPTRPRQPLFTKENTQIKSPLKERVLQKKKAACFFLFYSPNRTHIMQEIESHPLYFYILTRYYWRLRSKEMEVSFFTVKDCVGGERCHERTWKCRVMFGFVIWKCFLQMKWCEFKIRFLRELNGLWWSLQLHD